MNMSANHKDLIRRYLLWAYQTTKESFERIERKTTQLMVDEYLLKTLNRMAKPPKSIQKDYQKLVDEFKQYIVNKKQDELKQKFTDETSKSFHPQYLYLRNRLGAIEEAVKYFLGSRQLKAMKALYEEEFTRRILQAREHS
ncbi:MAG: hypothetical protein HY209_03895 [Candidatus Omnitrophica bacterium]|nr:hypothetical protein [Candidatus Omnitrophota bacterium]